MTVKHKEPSLLEALLPILLLVILLAINLYIFGVDGLSGSNQMVLIISSAIAVSMAIFRLGLSWEILQEGIVKSISSAMPSILILFLIGSPAGTWMLSGIVPAMIYYGLQFLSPAIFLVAACAVCCIVSVATGSSWTTVATVGVALLGIGRALGFEEGIIAGAIISGAYFGDKMSPLSDTTNLAPAVSGTDLFSHIRYMIWTAIPAFLISLLLFTLLGLSAGSSANLQSLEQMQFELQALFNITPLVLLPLVALFVLAVMKKPALPTIFIGAILGGVWALIFQQDIIASIMTPERSAGILAQLEVVWIALAEGISVEASSDDLTSLVSGGGMAGMTNTVWLI